MITRLGFNLGLRDGQVPEATEHLHREGWVVLRSAVEEDLLSRLRADVLRLFDGPPDDRAGPGGPVVTARIGLATTVSVDDASGGALASVMAGVERAEAELAEGRHDDALAELDEVAIDLGRVAEVVSPGRGIDLPAELIAGPHGPDPMRSDGQAQLGAVVHAVARRLPTAEREPADHRDEDAASSDSSTGLASPASPEVAALTDGHLPRAAAAIRRAASVDVDADEVADAVKEATGHLRATGPVVSRSVVAVVDREAGGYLGDTAGSASRAVRALREGDYQEAANLGSRLADAHAEIKVEVPADDPTGGHADSALRHLDEARILDALGDPEAALGRAVEAAEEYDAALATYDHSIDRAVAEVVGVDASEDARARVVSALDSTGGGTLMRARRSLEQAATEARSGDVAGAAIAGREASGTMEVARVIYSQPEASIRLGSEVRRAVEEPGPLPDASDFGKGAPRDVLDRTASPMVEAPPDGGPMVDRPDVSENDPALGTEPVTTGHEALELPTEDPMDDVTVDAKGTDAMDTTSSETHLDLD